MIGDGGDQPVNAGLLLPEGNSCPGQCCQAIADDAEHGLRLVGPAFP